MSENRLLGRQDMRRESIDMVTNGPRYDHDCKHKTMIADVAESRHPFAVFDYETRDTGVNPYAFARLVREMEVEGWPIRGDGHEVGSGRMARCWWRP